MDSAQRTLSLCWRSDYQQQDVYRFGGNAYFDGKEQQEEVYFFIEDKERVKDQLIHEFESDAKKYGLNSPKDTIVIDVVKLSLGMGVGVVVD